MKKIKKLNLAMPDKFDRFGVDRYIIDLIVLSRKVDEIIDVLNSSKGGKK